MACHLNPFNRRQPLVTTLLVLALAVRQSQSQSQSLFLKEILTGRCYEKMANANQCPQVVGSIMSVLDSQLDASMDSVSSYAPYLRQVDMTSPNNRALIWLTGNDGSFVGNSNTNTNTNTNTNQQQQQNNNGMGGYSSGYSGGYYSGGYGGGGSGGGGGYYSSNQPQQHQQQGGQGTQSSNFALHREMAPIELVTPEQTPGGYVMHDLVFCGMDRKSDCRKVDSNAYASFWAAAYSQFARTASGRVQIVIEPFADLTFLQTNVIQQLNAYQVNEVILYVDNCQDTTLQQLVDSFPITSVQCKDDFSDYAFFLLCQNPSSQACSMLSQVDTTGVISTQQTAAIEQQEEDELLSEKEASGGGGFFLKFILFGITCTLVYRYMQKPRGPPQYYQYDNVPPAETTTMRI